MSYYTIWTEVGLAKLANAKVTQATVKISEMAVGDGDGQSYDPVEDMTELKNEQYRQSLNDKYIHPDNSNWSVFEAVIPEDVGDFHVREVGLFDEDGDMLAIGKYPETYKPQLQQGAGQDLYVRMIMEVSNAENVELQVDPAVVLATRQYVDFIGDKIRHAIDQSGQEYDQTAAEQLWKTMELAGISRAKSGLEFQPNSYFREDFEDYGGIDQPGVFRDENVPELRMDMAQGDKTIDYGGIN